MLKVYNTLSRAKEPFEPLNPPDVKMYVCGITPYDETHLGHARAYVAFDVIRRYLEYSGFKVTHVQNITDIDDKIINKALKSGEKPASKESCRAVAEKYMESYFSSMDLLNIKRADIYPKATEHIKEMIDWIAGLISKGSAYCVNGDVYFEVNKFKTYGQLSGRKKADLQAGQRVAVNEQKKDPLDFALWKKAKAGEPSWTSPWGEGRPGWHIECTVMSTKYLGNRFDLHGGGMDLEFPHHENEIAQTEALTGEIPWVKYWVHNGFVTVNKQKMSKSLGNFFSLKEIFKKYDPLVVRFFLLLTHYRSPLNYSETEIESAREAFGRIKQFVQEIDFLLGKPASGKEEPGEKEIEAMLAGFSAKVRAALDDDFNTAGAVAAIFELIHQVNKERGKKEMGKKSLSLIRDKIIETCSVLGLIIGQEKSAIISAEEIERLMATREKARQAKDYQRADAIRKELADQGVILEDTPLGGRWKVQA